MGSLEGGLKKTAAVSRSRSLFFLFPAAIPFKRCKDDSEKQEPSEQQVHIVNADEIHESIGGLGEQATVERNRSVSLQL
jgi:hypothetical protein